MEQALPKAIQAELDAAAAIEQQLAQPAVAPVTENTPAEPVAETPPEPTQKPVPTPVATQESDDTWRSRYEVLEGKYRAEVPQLHQHNRELGNLLTSMQGEIEKLKNPPTPEKARDPLVTPKDETDFGADLIDLVRRVSSDEAQALLARLSKIEQAVAYLAQLPEQVNGVAKRQQMTDEERFWSAVNAVIPDWKSVDADPRWIAFLQTKPPFALQTFRELAVAAIQAHDHKPIVEMVKTWKTQEGIAESEARSNQTAQELNRQVAPNSKSATAAKPVTERIWSGEEYAAAYDVRLSNSKSEVEIEQLQSEAERALAEGRVRF